jgi:RHS repeat-associated protein
MTVMVVENNGKIRSKLLQGNPLFMKLLLPLTQIGSCLMLILLFAPAAFSSSNPYLSRHGINFSTGNKYLHQNDISLAGPIFSLRFSRNYNSQSSDTSILGYGWSFSWDERLIPNDNLGVIIHKRSDGSQVHFSPNGTDTWISQFGKKSVIVRTETGSTLTETNGSQLFFDNDGRLIEQRDKNGNAIQLSYDGDKLKTVTDAFGRSLTMNYSADSLLESIITPVGTYTYGYDNKKNLISATRPDGGAIRYLYEDTRDVHNLTGVIDAGGIRTQTIAYDNVDRAISSSLANNSESITISYENNFKRVITDSQGVATTYQLQANKGVARVVSMTGPGCSSCGGTSDTGYVYNERSQIVESTDANGVKTTYTYDTNGNATSVTKAAGTPLATTTTKTYDPITNQVATITRNSVANPGQSAVTTMTYDSHGNLLSRQESGFSGSDPISRITQYTYTATGQIAAIDGPRADVNDTVAFTYYPNEQGEGNNRGNLHTVTDALGHTTTFSDYNAFGQAQTITDANSLVTTRTYDGNGRLTATATAGLSTTYVYNATGQLQTVTLPGNRVITYTYTPAGQIQKVADSLGNSVSYLYDSEGRKTAEEIRDPDNLLTRYASYGYDNHGNLNKVTLPGDAEETAEYDLVGNLLKTVNATGMQTDYQYDDLNRLLATIEAGVNVAGYTYDSDDNVKTIKDAANHTTGYTMADFGRRIATSAPDTGQASYTYDAASNLLTTIDAKNQTTSYAYDALNRPLSQSYGDTEILFSYDQGENAIGRLSRVTDSEGTVDFTYDGAGRLVSETRVIGSTTHVTGYSYNAAGDMAGMTYPSGMEVSYALDAAGQISGIAIDGENLISAITRLPFGPLKSATLGSVNLSKTYDQRYNLSRITAGSFDYQYTRDTAGHVTRIDGIQIPATTSTTAAYSYNHDNNQLTEATPKVYTHDANGNITSDGTNIFVYDALNRLVKVERDGTTVAVYAYDSMDLRVRKTVGETTVHYIYDPNGLLIAETSADGTVQREYIYLDGEPLAVKEYQTSPGVYYFINDHLGTPQRLVTATGQIVWQAAYLPYGKAQVTVTSVQNNLRFPGQYFDAETGLHYNWHRFYDPETGRYISADPIGLAGGMNLYAYVENNPVNWVDPWGLFFYNPSDKPVLVKPEDNKKPPTLVGPGEFYPDQIDGFKPPAYNGDWYKVPNYTNGTLTPWGTPIEWGSGNLIPDFPDLGPITDKLPGRKGPGFEDRDPGWKDPSKCL